MEYFGIKEFSDVILEVENPDESGDDPIQFACHKVILAAASITFKNIFCKGEFKVGLYLAHVGMFINDVTQIWNF